jgi:hypothetical protein
MFHRIRIGAQERVFASRLRGRTIETIQVRYLRPGTHWLLGFGWSIHREDVRGFGPISLSGEEIEKIERLPEAASELAVVRLSERERAIVWIEGRLAAVVARGPQAFLRVGRKVRVEVVPAHEAIEPGLTSSALAVGRGSVRALEVPGGSVAFVLDEGVVRGRELGPGGHAFFADVPGLDVAMVRLGPRDLQVRVPEVWTRELWTSSVALTLRFRVKDARRWAESAGEDELALVVRQAVQDVFARRTFARVARDRMETCLALEVALAAAVGDWIEVLDVRLGDVVLLRRLVRRFRGFGERGREVAVALRDFAARPRVHERKRH